MTLDVMHDLCIPADDVQVFRHPRWSSRSVTLICGPPGSGKSTLARRLHSQVLELERFDGDPRHRMRMFGLYASRIGRAPTPDWAVVRGAPGFDERNHHEQLCRPARTIVLLTPPDVCHTRIEERGRETAGGEHAEVDRWWQVWRREQRMWSEEPRSARWQ